jgi:hypothetical protein
VYGMPLSLFYRHILRTLKKNHMWQGPNYLVYWWRNGND